MSASFSIHTRKRRVLAVLALALALALGALYRWWPQAGPGPEFASGNGRLEAIDINIASKLPGRLEDILVNEGDFVEQGQLLAVMDATALQAQLAEAQAHALQASHAVAAAQAQISLHESNVAAAKAIVRQRESDLAAARQRLARSQTLAQRGASSRQEHDDDLARVRSAEAGVAAAEAQVSSAEAGVTAARAAETGARATVAAAQATVTRIASEIDDTHLVAPRDGRIQLRIAQPGEILSVGGRVLNLLDLSDVSMIFFLPETQAGRLAIGSEARIRLDAAPEYVIPAQISFVSANAQFTPKTVETASERQKLMFRVKARIPSDLLKQHLQQVKTGLPGVIWVRLDERQDWPEMLRIALPQ